MTVYHVNKGIGWASSGVEYAQAYRSKVLNELNVDSKFIFTDMFLHENIEHFTSNIGFKDDQIIWLYQYFTDVKIAPTTYPLAEFEKTLPEGMTNTVTNANAKTYENKEAALRIIAFFKKDTHDIVQRVEYFSKEKLIRRDHYTYTKLITEYYGPKANQTSAYLRTYHNEDGSVAYEENCAGDQSVFRIGAHIFGTREELFAHFFESLNFSKDDVVLLDRGTDLAQELLDHKGDAKTAVVIHAEHYNENSTDEDYILWNNYYEYQFTRANDFDYFITSTDKQTETLAAQFEKYTPFRPRILTIPVGSLDELKQPTEAGRKAYSMITCSRLAGEKHIDWLVDAVAKAHVRLPEITLDIYGSGGQREKLNKLIHKHDATSYIRLMGHHDLTDVYRDYDMYLTGSTSEGFGLTLMEAIGSGLPIIGLDVPYGNQTFVMEGKNGNLIPRDEVDDGQVYAERYADKIVAFYSEHKIDAAHDYSYQRAEEFLTDRLKEKWTNFLEEVKHDSTL